MGNIFLYNHGGSANHGCEALVRTVNNLFKNDNNGKVQLYSESPGQDFHYDLHKEVEIKSAVHARSKLSLDFWKAYIHLKRTGDYFLMDVLPYLQSIRQLRSGDVEFSVGGDIYCYEDYPKFMKLHELICKRGCKTVLLGCSLDEKMFEDPDFVEDMRRYDYISARESLTYQLLQNAGLTNIGLAPDSAFTLPTEKLPLPEYFIEGNTIGLNVSPMVIRKEVSSGIVMKNYKRLIHSILDKTDCAVALIPHVVWEDNDDRTALQELYSEFENTKRVVMIDDCNCMQLKGYISSCRLFVGARTHATIAAYSSNVPTLVLGYSIKSRGIAKDLFGSDEKYVIPVQALENEGDLEKAFWWLWENEDIIRQRLEAVMPDYVAQVKSIKGKINLK
jgi:polysaccharide pyruvyl transferase WcaK-like protein